MDILNELAIIWAPTIASILAIVFAVSKCIGTVTRTCNAFRRENISDKLNEVIEENRQLKKMMFELIDKEKKINGYAERKYRHDKDKKNEETGDSQ